MLFGKIKSCSFGSNGFLLRSCLQSLTSCDVLHTVWSVRFYRSSLSQITSTYHFLSARWPKRKIGVVIIFQGWPLVLLLLIAWLLLCLLTITAPVFGVYLLPAYWALFHSSQPRINTEKWPVVCGVFNNTEHSFHHKTHNFELMIIHVNQWYYPGLYSVLLATVIYILYTTLISVLSQAVSH